MKVRALVLAIAILFVVVCFETAPGHAETSPPVALSGVVSSAEEGPMEGVLVGAKKAGSTITTTVVSDDHGRYRFPSSKLTPGRAAVSTNGYKLTHTMSTSSMPLARAASRSSACERRARIPP